MPSDDLSSSSKNSVLQQSLSRFDPSPILVGQAFSLYDRVRVSGHAEPRWVASSRWNSETHTWEYQTVNRGGGEDEKWVSEVNLASDGAGPDAESISVRARTRFRRKWKAERFRRLEAEEHDRKATLVQQVQQGLNEMAVSCKSEAKGEKACGDEGCLWESYEVSLLNIV